MVRILLADDNPMVLYHLRTVLEQRADWQVCAEARTGDEALERVQRMLPDIILLDFQMPGLNGLDTAWQISQLFPEIPILMVTVHISKQLTAAAQSVGIRGACAKWEAASIVEGVDALLHHETYFPEAIAVSV